ncbi:MAG: nitroreductase family protein [Syntrophobacteraceae bacterium]
MADITDVILKRRSIRNYEERQVPEEVLDRVLEAVRWTPSWANTQCWEIILVKDREMKEKLQQTMSKGNPATRAIVEAPVVMAVCGKLQSAGFYKGQSATKFGDWFMFDLGLATQTLCLAAQNEGLGTVIAGLFDHEKAKQALEVPEGYELVTLIPLGYAAKPTGAPGRREISQFVHHEKF